MTISSVLFLAVILTTAVFVNSLTINDLVGTWVGNFTQQDVNDPSANSTSCCNTCITPFSVSYTVTYYANLSYVQSWNQFVTTINNTVYTYPAGGSVGVVLSISGNDVIYLPDGGTYEDSAWCQYNTVNGNVYTEVGYDSSEEQALDLCPPGNYPIFCNASIQSYHSLCVKQAPSTTATTATATTSTSGVELTGLSTSAALVAIGVVLALFL